MPGIPLQIHQFHLTCITGTVPLAARCSFGLTAAAVAVSPGAAATAPPAVHADLLLSDIRVVLVAPKHEANIGAVARACANFECLSLFLVAPRCAVGSGGVGAGEARKVACGDAVLDRLVVTDTLAEALADTAGSIGFTRRAGATRVTHASLGHLLAGFPWALQRQPPQPPPPPPAQILLSTSVAPVEHALPATPSSSSWDTLEPTFAVQQVPDPELEPSLEPSSLQQLLYRQRPDPPLSSTSLVAAAAVVVVVGGGGLDLADTDGSGNDSGVAPHRPHATALVFGREESGLSEAELRLCRCPGHACAIPTGRLQPSMNLSHAVAVVLGEIFSRRCGLLGVTSPAEAAQAAADLDAAGSSDGGTGGQSPHGGDCDGGGGTVGARTGACSTTSAQEVDLLVRKVAAVAEAVGISGEEGSGGGGSGAESRSLHGLASAVLQRLDPKHPLEARKMLRKKQQQQQQQQQEQQQQQQQP
ncbi:hypothetical protein VOLCADRAFT_118107 [Volvox carteri f. nagariensis]|uniref:tRNA/rRNA methyltransferase SpoU type domain-containing protein n=1 Tax=Volvox carteri f. nagariensis TaxID=3068 RepID=D8U1U0_VOLCA|nr:uncharacterized protein VOLCADRAFT_118107 [Volvox carteri f. nagariensis]EFJ46240.1 hypothetical protein VOLCADRAFT_118107 [Volvox carteri f. nagariensis]|eukprot:XP_002952687.1 hypothetical protein VOLCADRAFT_118107 [Volvox carteri f. nagariensis]